MAGRAARPSRLHWLSDTTPSACLLIDIAGCFDRLRRQVTRKSAPILSSKLVQLAHASTEAEFQEILTELEVAGRLSLRASPISFEPLVPEGMEDAPSKPRSPDLAIRLPGGDVFVEVTTVYVGFLEKWGRATERLEEGLSRLVSRHELQRWIRYSFPLRFEDRDVGLVLASVRRSLRERESGEATVETSLGQATVAWGTVPVIVDDETPLPSGDGVFVRASRRVEVSTIVAIRGGPALPVHDSATDDVIRSLRRSLDAKLAQFTAPAPYVVAIRLGSSRIRWGWLRPKVSARIWPNPRYRRISALLLFEPRQTFDAKGRPSTLRLFANPNAAVPAPQNLFELFEGQTFHLP